MARLLLEPIYKYDRNTTLNRWKSGEVFKIHGTLDYTTIKTINKIRYNYTSVAIQYDKGIIEV